VTCSVPLVSESRRLPLSSHQVPCFYNVIGPLARNPGVDDSSAAAKPPRMRMVQLLHRFPCVSIRSRLPDLRFREHFLPHHSRRMRARWNCLLETNPTIPVAGKTAESPSRYRNSSLCLNLSSTIPLPFTSCKGSLESPQRMLSNGLKHVGDG
jgi:hypothetical protein